MSSLLHQRKKALLGIFIIITRHECFERCELSYDEALRMNSNFSSLRHEVLLGDWNGA